MEEHTAVGQTGTLSRLPRMTIHGKIKGVNEIIDYGRLFKVMAEPTHTLPPDGSGCQDILVVLHD